MKNVLVPVDSSESATRALQFAIGLAQQHGPLGLHIVTAHEPAFESTRTLAYLPLEKFDRILREHSEAILQPAIDAASAAGVPFTSEILIGSVPKVIADCALARQCDAIVMGTRGLGAIGNLVLGSVAMKVIHVAKVPVMLVK